MILKWSLDRCIRSSQELINEPVNLHGSRPNEESYSYMPCIYWYIYPSAVLQCMYSCWASECLPTRPLFDSLIKTTWWEICHQIKSPFLCSFTFRHRMCMILFATFDFVVLIGTDQCYSCDDMMLQSYCNWRKRDASHCSLLELVINWLSQVWNWIAVAMPSSCSSTEMRPS
jgi:hypothetical protein